jgi:hypothetical protein
MSQPLESPTPVGQAAATPEHATVKGAPVAFALHRITLHEGADEDEFERFMLEELFPAVNTNPDGEPDQHFLLKSDTFGPEYLWMSRMEYWIHHTPLPNWLLNRVEEMPSSMRDKLERFGTRTSSDVFYDVTGWRRALGK